MSRSSIADVSTPRPLRAMARNPRPCQGALGVVCLPVEVLDDGLTGRLVGLILEDDRPAVGRERPDIVAGLVDDREAVGVMFVPAAAAAAAMFVNVGWSH